MPSSRTVQNSSPHSPRRLRRSSLSSYLVCVLYCYCYVFSAAAAAAASAAPPPLQHALHAQWQSEVELAFEQIRRSVLYQDLGIVRQQPLLLEAREVEEEILHRKAFSAASGGRSASASHQDRYGQNDNIFTHWDDPACDYLLFPKGLNVCGDVKIRKSLHVMTGINLTAIAAEASSAESGFASRSPSTLLRRCSFQPPPDVTQWCYLSLTVRSARVLVSPSLEVGGSLYAGSVRVDGAASALIGMRGVMYTGLADVDLSAYAEEYAATAGEISRRREKALNETLRLLETSRFNKWLKDALEDASARKAAKRREQQQSLSREPLSVDDYKSMMQERKEIIAALADSNEDAQSSHSRRSGAPPRTLLPQLGEENQMPRKKKHEADATIPEGGRRNEVRIPPTFKCPIISSYGNALFIYRDKQSGALQVETDFSSANSRQNSVHFPPLADHSSSPGWFSTWAPSESRAYDSSRSPRGEVNPWGQRLPYLAANASLGDLVSLSNVAIGNGGFMWVFGNVAANGIVVESGRLISQCGQVFLNATDDTGLTALVGSSVVAGGLLESVTSHLAAHRGANVLLRGSLISARLVQVSRGSDLYIGGELLTAALTAVEASAVEIWGAAEAEFGVEIAETSTAIFAGDIEFGFLQILSRSEVRFRDSEVKEHTKSQVHQLLERQGWSSASGAASELIQSLAIVSGTLVVDASAKLYADEASVMVHGTFDVGNSSSLHLNGGDLFVSGAGACRIVNSKVVVAGNILASDCAILIGLGSEVSVGKGLLCAGIPVREARTGRPSKAAKNPLNARSPTPLKTAKKQTEWKADGGQSAAAIAPSLLCEAAAGEGNGTCSSLNGTTTANFQEGDDGTATSADNSTELLLPRPALLVDSSLLVVGGLLEIGKSWVQVQQGASVEVAEGVWLHEPTTSALQLTTRSTLLSSRGSVIAGVALLIDSRSLLQVPKGTVTASAAADVRTGALLQAKRVMILGPMDVAENARLEVTKEVVVASGSLTAASGAVLLAASVVVRNGQLFVEDGAIVAAHKSVLALGSITAQDRGLLRCLAGSIVTAKGDIVAENAGHITADQFIAFLTATTPDKLAQATANNPVTPSTELDGLWRAIAAAPFNSTARRTAEGEIAAGAGFLPATLKVDVFVQEPPDILLKAARGTARESAAESVVAQYLLASTPRGKN